LAVDGHGHLYVFRSGYPTNREEYVVDVYGREGGRRFTGKVQGARFRWGPARGDAVYGWRQLEDGNLTVVRYRIIEPFD